jgi:hypothetical protein
MRKKNENNRKQEKKTKSMSASLKSSYLAHQQVTGAAVIRATNDRDLVFFLGHVDQAPQAVFVSVPTSRQIRMLLAPRPV